MSQPVVAIALLFVPDGSCPEMSLLAHSELAARILQTARINARPAQLTLTTVHLPSTPETEDQRRHGMRT